MDATPLATSVTLPDDLAEFAAEAIASGRYETVSAMILAGLRLLQDFEAQRAAFIATLEEANAEGERDGFLTSEEVRARVTASLNAVAQRQA